LGGSAQSLMADFYLIFFLDGFVWGVLVSCHPQPFFFQVTFSSLRSGCDFMICMRKEMVGEVWRSLVGMGGKGVKYM